MELHVERVSKWYYRKREGANRFFAVKECSFALSSKSLTVLTGRSGSGKTTLLHMLGTLLKPNEGSILLDGRNPYAMGEKERSLFRNQTLGIIPQGYTALHSLTLMENLLLPFHMYRREGDRRREQEVYEEAERLLERFGLSSLREEYPQKLSGGEIRRLAVARALAGKPPVILADEPTGDLDDGNTRVVMEELRRAADEGAICFVVTHEASARDYADQAFRMNGGELCLEEEW